MQLYTLGSLYIYGDRDVKMKINISFLQYTVVMIIVVDSQLIFEYGL